MKKIIILLIVFAPVSLISQVPGYYNGVEGKDGEELKTALNEIISGHVDFSYSDAKYILNYADSDPENPNNVILFYTKRSQSNSTWGSGSNDINREHVWAKSHGDFSGVRPMDGDAFNLHPSDASVNILKSNYDFDECSASGTYISEADAYYTSSQFEPSDQAKGEVSRTIFYMAVRYEGEDGEMDLEAVDQVETYPSATHGKLSTLLQWNKDFPPTDLERRRNERVFEAQNNRNPFIDHPEFANLIWGGASLSGISIGEVELEERYPLANTSTSIQALIQGNTVSTFYYGSNWDSQEHSSVMAQDGNKWTGVFNLNGFQPGDLVYYKIVASDGENSEVLRGSYPVPENKILTPISEVQGTGLTTPLLNTVVSIGGIVSSNFDNSYYIQNGNDQRNGICIYDIRRGNIGDSVVVTGKAVEYNNLTELTDVTYSYTYSVERNLVPKIITITEADEDYEGMLVTIENVTFLEGDATIPLSEQMTLNFTDGVNNMTVYSRYNSRLGGKVVPSGTVNVTGVVSQYQNSYQLLINSIEDIVAGEDNEAPLLAGIVVNDANWIEVSFSEKIDKTSAEIVTNFSISDGVNIEAAYLYNETKVLLFVSGLKEQEYTLTVSNVSDLRGNAISEASMSFQSEYTSVPFGDGNDLSFKCYPNPANSFIILELPEQLDGVNMQIINMQGRTIRDFPFEKNSEVVILDVSTLINGSYILKLNTLSNSFIEHISIQN